jgi:WD40 repeat protein
VSCGSADRIVHIWDSTTTQPLYYLPGHKGSVNQVSLSRPLPSLGAPPPPPAPGRGGAEEEKCESEKSRHLGSQPDLDLFLCEGEVR